MGSNQWRRSAQPGSALGTAERVLSTILADRDEGPNEALGRESCKNAHGAYSAATNNANGMGLAATLDMLQFGDLTDSPIARRIGGNPNLVRMTPSTSLLSGRTQLVPRSVPQAGVSRAAARFGGAANRVLGPLGLIQGIGQAGDGIDQIARRGDWMGLTDVLGGTSGAVSAGTGMFGATASAGLATSVAAAPVAATVGAAAAGLAGGLALGTRGNTYASEQGLLGYQAPEAAGRGAQAGAQAARGRDWSDASADIGMSVNRSISNNQWLRNHLGVERTMDLGLGAGALGTLGTTGIMGAGAAITGAAGLATDAYSALSGGASWLWNQATR